MIRTILVKLKKLTAVIDGLSCISGKLMNKVASFSSVTDIISHLLYSLDPSLKMSHCPVKWTWGAFCFHKKLSS